MPMATRCDQFMEKIMPEKMKALPIRKLLFLTYGCNVVMAFGVVLAICAGSIFTLRDNIISEGKMVLMDQVKVNSAFIAAEAGNVFEAKVHTGLYAFVLPAVYSIMDAHLKGSSYSVNPGPSYPDNDAALLKKPLTTDPRYPCKYGNDVAVAEKRGCLDSGMQEISVQASSTFITGFEYEGSNVDQLMSTNEASVSLTSVMDDFVEDTWLLSADWVESFVAWAQGRIYRQFPGVVGNLTNAYNAYEGVRFYDPTARPWYKKALGLPKVRMDMSMDSVGRYSVAYSEPYRDLFGKGFLMGITVPIFGTDGSALGVAGTDLRCDSIEEMIATIRIRKSGAAHLFHKGSKKIVASGEWHPATATDTKHINSVQMNRKSQVTFQQASGGFYNCGSAASEEVEGTLLVYKPILGGEFCITAATPMEEVLQPIEEQIDSINSVANSLFISSLMICLISFALVSLSVVWLAMRMSAPLISTCRDTHQIVLNVGGNLFEGIKTDSKGGGIGEVRCLRDCFVDLVNELKLKRERSLGNTVPPLNPLYQHFPAAASGMAKVQGILKVDCERGQPECTDASIGVNIDSARPALKARERIAAHLALKLILPLVVALIVIIAMTSSSMSARTQEWIQPLTDEMIREELSMLDIRAYELAQLVSEVMGSYADTLEMVRHYSEDVLSGNMQLRGIQPNSPFSPTSYCQLFSNQERPADCEPKNVQRDTRRQLKGNGETVRDIHLDSSVWYAPANAIEGTRSASPKAQQEGLGAHLDNVARVGFFSSEVTFVYFGFEDTEVYRQYPYTKIPDTMVDRSIKCIDPNIPDGGKRRVNQWTPKCRWWYKGAVKNQGKVTFNPVDIDSVTRQPFVSISATMRKPGGGIYGVAAVDANIAKIEHLMKQAKFYDSGFAYLYDEAGFGIIHQEMKGRSGRFHIEDLAAGEDSNFRVKYVDGVKNKFGQKGTWKYPWLNPETDEEEVWAYSFLPVPGVPYQLVVTVLDREVNLKAQELEDRMLGYIVVHEVVTTIIFLVSTFLLVAFSLWFNNHFANPISGLTNLIVDSKASGWQDDPDPASKASAISAELRAVFDNFQKVLIALRFGNPQYIGASKRRNLENLKAARQLLESTGNQRGIGVCLSNLGNVTQDANMLNQAVKNARDLANSGHHGVTQDTVGQRIFGLVLLHLEQQNIEKAKLCLQEVLELHTGTGSWQQLAKAAYVLAQRAGPEVKEGEEEQQDVPMLLEVTMAAVKILMQQPGGAKVSASDGMALVQLYYALYKANKDKMFIMVALANVPHIDNAILLKLAKVVKYGGSDEVIKQLDAGMQLMPGWVPGQQVDDPEVPPGPKAVVFLVDRTWHPILNAAVTSVRNVFDKNMSEDDYVGYYSLGDGWIFPPTQKCVDENGMLEKIQTSEVVSGRPLLYQSMNQCLQQLLVLPVSSKWLIVLSDTVDLEDPCDLISVFKPGMKVMAPNGDENVFREAEVTGVHGEQATVRWQAQGGQPGRGGSGMGTSGNRPEPEAIQSQDGPELEGPGWLSATVPQADCQMFAAPPEAGGQAEMMEQRLQKAGARTGQVTISLMWDNLKGGRSDLDLHTMTPVGEICYSNKTLGGGFLDVDMRSIANEPVENCFFEDIPNGNYSSKVRNYIGASPKPFVACIRSRIPITLNGEIFQGKKMCEGTCHGSGESSDVPTFSFSVDKTPPPGADQVIQARVGEVLTALTKSPNMNLVVINSRAISGWNPQSPKWPTFSKNVEDFVGALGSRAHHLEAKNAAEVAKRFDEVASMIDAGLSEQL